MTTLSLPADPRLPRARGRRRLSADTRRAVIAALVAGLGILLLHLLKPKGLGYFDVSSIAAGAAPLAIGALGLGIVVLAGGIDLSVGAVISLTNVALVRLLGESGLGSAAYSASAFAVALAVGGGCGAVNGLFVSGLRLQPVVVTLAVMFIAQGVALLVLPSPGGTFSDDTSALFVGDLVPGALPASVAVIMLAVAAWLYIGRCRIGPMLRAVGSDPDGARASGLRVGLVRFSAYVLAGLFYGMAGLAITANTASGDPLIGTPMLLKLFAAVVLGGIAIGGGRGTPVGAVFGAVSLSIVTTVMLISGIQTYYVPIAEGTILLVAVFAFSADRKMPAWRLLASPPRPGRSRAAAASLAPRLAFDVEPATDQAQQPGPTWRWDLPVLRMAGPSALLALLVVGLSAMLSGSGFSIAAYLVPLLVFTTFLAVIGLGQGAVVISGGLDLSVGWAMTFPAVVLTMLSRGADTNAGWAIPLVLFAGAGIGLLNGALVVGFGLSPIIVTLAVAGILEGLTLVISGGAPTGYVPPVLSAFVNGRLAGLPPMVWCLFAFVLAAYALLNRSVFGHRLTATGHSAWIARLSGVRTGRILLGAYGLSGLCAATAGILLAGFTGTATYDLGRPYLLASIAVVVLGGTDIRGGRGHYAGIFAGSLLFTALSSLLAATTLPEAVRSVIYGVVLMAAVLSMRSRA